ncbi:MAG: sigma-70 family RNA polymerase sigma factor [Akkermansia sp.]|nr:sigma-70 family RNA polymerase sigma factor [Akkermansia sp.]
MSKKYTKAELKKLEETELVKLSQEGVLAAFDELLKRNSHRIVGMLTQMLKSETDAYDVTQTAAVKAYRSIKKFNGTSQFYTWLYTIALNEARNFLRKESKHRYQASLNDDTNGDPLEKDSHAADRALESDPVRRAQVSDLRTSLRKALAQLSDAHREIVIMCDIEGMSYMEVSLILNVPEPTLRSRLHYAHRYLQSLLKDER